MTTTSKTITTTLITDCQKKIVLARTLTASVSLMPKFIRNIGHTLKAIVSTVALQSGTNNASLRRSSANVVSTATVSTRVRAVPPNVGAPSLTGIMIENSSYRVLGVGSTDRIFLLGHGDGININDPYQVIDIYAAVKALGGDSTSPLLRGLLELYYGGSRDIWLIAVAPMNEFILDPAQRTDSYYSNYAVQLQVAYDLLLQWDLPQILIPMEAPFNTNTDFLTPLAQHCSDSLDLTGELCIGILGTRKNTPLTYDEVINMGNDPRIQNINNISDIGKFVSVFVGEGTINLQEMPGSYVCSMATSVGCMLSQSALNQSIVYKSFSNIIDTIGSLDNSQISYLVNAQLNPVAKTTIGNRGTNFQVVAFSDNTIGQPGTDYWSLCQLRLVQQVIDYVRALGKRFLGSIGYIQLQRDVQTFMEGLVSSVIIRGFSLNISRDPTNRSQASVNISITPYFGLRNITFTMTVGPGA